MLLPDLTAKRAMIHPQRAALVDPERGRTISYAQLDDRASRAAAFLAEEWGVVAGDRIATLAHNRTDAVELLFACAKIGAVLVPLNWRLARTELAYILDDAEPVGLVHDRAHREMAGLLRDGRAGLRTLDADTDYEAALDAASGRPMVHDPRDETALWYLIYTSGTTGRPKGVHQTAGMALVNYLNIGIAAGMTHHDRFLSVLPQFHTGGWNLYTLPMILVGGTVVIPKGFDPAQTLELLQTDVTAFFGVPAVYQMLAEHPDFPRADLSGVRSWSAGGAAMPVPLIERLARAGVSVQQGMGMTETGPTVFLLDEEHAVSKAGSVGTPQPYVDVRIVDRDGRAVPTGQPGELLIRGPGVTTGYWRNPAATASAFESGWLHSGDVARQDEDGFYYLVDRIKDMYISGGENVYPAEVEAVIHRFPGVRSCAVIGVPDERWGEVGRAVVEPEPGAGVEPAAIREFCREHLAAYKVPATVQVVDELPRSAMGKILKHLLRGDTATPAH